MPPPRQSNQDHPSDPAPWFKIPNKEFICIEHPAKVQNLEKAVATLGGEKALAKLSQTNGQSGLSLRLRSWDPFQHPIHSRTVPTSNVLLKISIPKRRRKRRPHNEEGQDSVHLTEDIQAKTLYDRLRESNGNYTVEPMGIINTTIRFRDIADFQYSTAHSPFANKFRDSLIDCTYEKIKNFKLELDDNTHNPDIIPPPTFSKTVIPHIYNYHQNPAVKKAIIDGQATLLNLQAAPKTLTTMVHISSVRTPSGPPENTPDISTLDDFTRSCIDRLKLLFSQRPIWTRRALVNNFPAHLHPMIRFSMVHVAYMWRAGPWRDTCVVYGVDPREDPKYRKYQSLFFQFEVDNKKKIRDNTSHIFDGKTLVKDGRCFQLCDITDPLLKSLIDRDKIRKKCHPQDGWYRSGTMIKIKGIMRQKIRALVEDNVGAEIDAKITSILEDDSDEDEEGNQNPKISSKHKKKKIKPSTSNEKAQADVPENSIEDDQGDEDDDAERNDEWEEGAAMLESEWTAETVDRRVDEFMLELMKQGNEQGEMDEDQALQDDGFDILEGSSEDEG
ncbi:RNA polymerase III transcription factor IIIC subunit-domain-containing protein [Kalaharituber pfeilii]|nr:RNA polymerase III transcription factor IIIC subunit-domain-containing protein [Kalaharituber pfeilii]